MVNASLIKAQDLGLADRQSMFSLFERYYSAVNFSGFNTDLDEKDYALILQSEDRSVIGFTTIQVIDFDLEGIPGRALFSGDTIIHHKYWGNQVLLKAWCEFAGRMKVRDPALPMYWFLIVKGHKTYRYLPDFTRSFYPRSNVPTPQSVQHILDHLARRKFGEAYNPELGLVQYRSSRGHLRPEWADVPDRLAGNAHVDFFLKRNPAYRLGHELVCIAELRAENMRFHARQAFLAGAAGLPPAPEQAGIVL